MLAPPLIFAGFVAMAAVGMFRDNPNDLESTRTGQQGPCNHNRNLTRFQCRQPRGLGQR